MDGRLLLDTSVVIPLLKGEDSILEKLRTAETVLLPYIVVGELYYGAFNSSRTHENTRRIDNFVNDSIVISSSTEIAREYGIVKTELKYLGHPIPENDIWIAAIARHYNLTLITRDQHFSFIRDLAIEYW